MPKQLAFSQEARSGLKVGMDILAKAVITTLGPKGRNVALDKKWGAPTITHDGVSVAKEIELEDPYANMGAQLLKEAATKTNEIAGDGTTTATALAYYMVTEGLRNLAAGPGQLDDDGKRITLEVQVGDRVLYAKYSGTEIKLDNKKVLIFREADILAVVES